MEHSKFLYGEDSLSPLKAAKDYGGDLLLEKEDSNFGFFDDPLNPTSSGVSDQLALVSDQLAMHAEQIQLHQSMMDEIQEAGLQDVARDSGLVTSQGAIPNVYHPPPLLNDAAMWPTMPLPASNSNFGEEDDEEEVAMNISSGSNNSRRRSYAEATGVKEEDPSDAPYEESSSYVSPPKRGRGRQPSSSTRKRSKSRRGKGDDASSRTKGLRHFSLAVCNKVREKGLTSYNEVADDLVREMDNLDGKNDEKNIRRRVYDALNVLSAMDIIRKVKKEIHWVGLPSTDTVKLSVLQEELTSRADRVAKKEEHLQELISQLRLYSELIERNAKNPAVTGEKLALPFIVISASNSTKIDLRVSSDRSEYVLDFTHPFRVMDDQELLAQMFPVLPAQPQKGGSNNNNNNNNDK